MIYCPQCGSPNFDDANYCNICGEPLVNAELYDEIRNKAEMEAYLERQQREREAQAYSKAYRKAQKDAKREAARMAKEQEKAGAVGAHPNGAPGATGPTPGAVGTHPNNAPAYGDPIPNRAPAATGPTPGAAGSHPNGAPGTTGTHPNGAPASSATTVNGKSAATTSDPAVAQPDFPVYKHGCLAQAWDDITESPGWGKRICLLGLVNMVPVLNFFVTGYSMRWAGQLTRDEISPMPQRIFADGLFVQGFYAFVISLLVGLVTGAVSSIVGAVPLVGAACSIFVSFVLQMYWGLAVMRVEISGSLGHGFDIADIFKTIFSNRFGKVFCVTVVPFLIVGAAVLFICGSLLIIFGMGLIYTTVNAFELVSTGFVPWTYFIQSIMAMMPLVLVMYLVGAFLGAICTVLTLRATAHYIVRYERAWTIL